MVLRLPHLALLSLRCNEFGLDLDDANVAGGPCAKAGPRPIFWSLAQAALYRIAMNVLELRHKSGMIADIVIEIASLPERRSARRPVSLTTRFDGNSHLEHLHNPAEHTIRRLIQQQMHMLGHNDIAEDMDFKLSTRIFEGLQESLLHVHLREQRLALITAAGDEVVCPER